MSVVFRMMKWRSNIARIPGGPVVSKIHKPSFITASHEKCFKIVPYSHHRSRLACKSCPTLKERVNDSEVCRDVNTEDEACSEDHCQSFIFFRSWENLSRLDINETSFQCMTQFHLTWVIGNIKLNWKA